MIAQELDRRRFAEAVDEIGRLRRMLEQELPIDRVEAEFLCVIHGVLAPPIGANQLVETLPEAAGADREELRDVREVPRTM